MNDDNETYDYVGAYADGVFTVLSVLLLVFVEIYERKRKQERNKHLTNFTYIDRASTSSNKTSSE